MAIVQPFFGSMPSMPNTGDGGTSRVTRGLTTNRK